MACSLMYVAELFCLVSNAQLVKWPKSKLIIVTHEANEYVGCLHIAMLKLVDGKSLTFQ